MLAREVTGMTGRSDVEAGWWWKESKWIARGSVLWTRQRRCWRWGRSGGSKTSNGMGSWWRRREEGIGKWGRLGSGQSSNAVPL